MGILPDVRRLRTGLVGKRYMGATLRTSTQMSESERVCNLDRARQFVTRPRWPRQTGCSAEAGRTECTLRVHK